MKTTIFNRNKESETVETFRNFIVELCNRNINQGKPIEIKADEYSTLDGTLAFRIDEKIVATFARNEWVFVQETI